MSRGTARPQARSRFGVGRQLAFDPRDSAGFVGDRHKHWLLPMQQAIIRFVLQARE